MKIVSQYFYNIPVTKDFVYSGPNENVNEQFIVEIKNKPIGLYLQLRKLLYSRAFQLEILKIQIIASFDEIQDY